MRNKVVINISVYCLLFQHATSQYDPQVYGEIQQAYQYPYQNIAYPQYANQRKFKHYNNNKWIQENYEDYNDYSGEICACDKCDETIRKPSCKEVCPNCFSTPPPVIAPSYVFLPYPYPYPIPTNTTLDPNKQIEETTTASVVVNTVKTTITTEISTAETKAKETETIKALTSEAITLSNALPEENNDVYKEKSPFNIKDKGQYTLTALRRTKPNWLPKYGIVPISDKFAEKLMLQLRSMRVLHPQKENMRNIDIIAR